MKTKNKCIDCNKIVSFYAKRCEYCFGNNNSGSNNVNYKSGKPKCIDCKTLLKNYNSTRCRKCTDKNKTGKNNPNYGKGMHGKNHPNYIDGRTLLIPSIRNLRESNIWINKIFKRDNYTCQECGDSTGGNLQAHHKKPFAIILSEFLKEYDQFSPLEDKKTLVRLATKYKPDRNLSDIQTL